MRRLVQLMRTPLYPILAISGAFGIRVFASLGRPIARFPDSLGYESFHLFGSIDRFWPIPFLYSIVQTDTARVALHVVVGTCAWTWCALLLSRSSRYPRAVLAFVLLLGLSPQVVRYDLAILSESLGISFMVFAIASTINLQRQRSTAAVAIWITSISLCALTRPVHLILLLGVVVVPLFSVLIRRARHISLSTVVLGFVLLTGLVQLRANSTTSSLNLYTDLQEQVITSNTRFDWFVKHGMPHVEGMRNAHGYDYAENFPAEISRIISLPKGQQPPALMRVGGVALARWVRDDGWTTYVRYLASHPHDSLSRITSLTNATLSPPNDDFLPLDNGPMIPRVLFGSWELWSIIGIGSLVLVFLRSRKEFAILGGFFAVISAVYAISMLTSGIEHPRHAVTSAVALRLTALAAAIYAMPRSTPQAAPDESVDERL